MSTQPESLGTLETVASEWIARRDRGLTVSEQAELDVWLSEPRHAEAFARCSATWDALPGLRALPPERLAALIRPRNRRRRLAPVIAFAGAATALAAAWVFWLRAPAEPLLPSSPLRLCTAPADAEARVALDDGSVIIMRRGSQIQVLERVDARRVRLLAGEAEFTVKKDPQRPFAVHAGSLVVRDIGTVFDVSLRPDEIRVLVTEGEVALRPAVAEGTSASTPVVAHQRAVVPVGREAAMTVSAANETQEQEGLAWKSRRLSFARTPLSDAVAEINRYNVVQLEVADASLATLLVSGSIQSDNLDGFLRMLEGGFDVSAERNDRTVMLKAR